MNIFNDKIYEPIAASNFSFLYGASHPREMVEAAKALGLEGIGIADKNTLAGVVRAYAAAREANFRLIAGARLVEASGFTAIVYPKHRKAWGALCRVLTRGNRRSKKGQCELFEPDLLEAMAGSCSIFIPDNPLSEEFFTAAKTRIRNSPPDCNLYIAITRPYDGTDNERNHQISEFARLNKIRTIATTDAIMHINERRIIADVLACIRNHTTVDRAGYLSLQNAERQLKSPQEMMRIFKGYEEALTAAQELFELVKFSLGELQYEFPDVEMGSAQSLIEHLKALTEKGASGRYPQGIPPKVRKIIDHEYKLIEELDIARYFLTVHDMVRFARDHGILCQGRGSAANSAVCFCLGITSVDPAKTELLFERFVSPERKEPPDIDVDFQNDRREEVIQYIYEKYGREHAGITGVVVTYRGRSALRETAKVLGLSNDMIDALSKSVSGWGRGSVDNEIISQMSGLNTEAPRIKETIEIARILHGFPRHLSQHVGGFVITKTRLDECVPISNAAMDDRTFIEWDKDDLDTLGILKIDVLALGMLTCVSECFELLECHYGQKYDMATIPAEDSKTYDMICAADTIGVFQIESRAQMSMLPRLRPRVFYDLVIEVAIVRPGPIQGNMVHPYLRRRQGIEKTIFPSKELEEVLGKTLGVPLFQEQAMKIAIVAAGFTPSEADRLRRAMATFRKVGIIHEFEEKLINGMVKNGYDNEFATNCFRQIEGFGEYGFPESHAASFALIVYVSAWLKCHYPDVFLVAILNAQPMGFYSVSQLISDARNHGVKVLPIDVNYSVWDNALEKQDNGKYAVRLGLRQVKGLQETEAARLIDAKERLGGVFENQESLKQSAKLNARAMELLAGADAFGAIGLKRRDAVWGALGLKEGELPLFSYTSEYGKDENADLPTMHLSEEVLHDYKRLKLSLKGHPVQFFRPEFDAKGIKNSSDFKNITNGSYIGIGGIMLLRQRPGTAKGVLFMTLEDEFGTMNIIVWPKILQKYRKEALRGKFLIIYGRLQKDDGETPVVHLIANRIIDISARLKELEMNSRDFR